MAEQAVGRTWPSGPPPAATDGMQWDLHEVAELPAIRAQLRRHLQGATQAPGPRAAELRDQLVLAFDEMASNALRHGGGRVSAAVRLSPRGYLVEVSDAAAAAPPTPLSAGTRARAGSVST